MTESTEHAVPSVRADMLIGGHSVTGIRRLRVTNPADPAEEVGTIPLASVQEVFEAVRGAKVAQRAWQEKSFAERAALIAANRARMQAQKK